MSFDLDRYLERIGVARAEIAPDPHGLARLQNAQMRAITFENIDPLLGRVPDLDADALWTKLVLSRRGGYCMELNALFGRALDALGFDAAPTLARVRVGAPKGGPRTHHAFVVSVDGEDYLADVGFGGPAPAGPIRLGIDGEQERAGVRFRVVRDEATGEEVLERGTADGWFSLYGIDRVPATEADFETANFVCARWDKSQFPRVLMMTRLNAEGRTSLRNRDLREIGAEETISRKLGDEADLAATLRGPFALDLDDATVAAVWRRIEEDG